MTNVPVLEFKFIYFGVNRLKAKVTRHKNSAGVGMCTLVSAGFFLCCVSVQVVEKEQGVKRILLFEVRRAKMEARRVDSRGGVLGRASSPSLLTRGYGGAL